MTNKQGPKSNKWSLKQGPFFKQWEWQEFASFWKSMATFSTFWQFFFYTFSACTSWSFQSCSFLYLYVEKSSSVESSTRCRRRIYPLLHCYVINQSASPTPHLVTLLLCYILHCYIHTTPCYIVTLLHFTLLHCYIHTTHYVTLLCNKMSVSTDHTNIVYQMSSLYFRLLQILTDFSQLQPNIY